MIVCAYSWQTTANLYQVLSIPGTVIIKLYNIPDGNINIIPILYQGNTKITKHLHYYMQRIYI